MMRMPACLLAATALLSACSEGPTVTSNTTVVEPDGVEEVMPSESDVLPAPADNADEPGAPRAQADYIGRWKGVEGMYLNVAAKPGGGVTLDMQWDLDNKGKFDGSVTAEGLRFTRNGTAETAVHTDGAATGLKWLDGKQDCLTVKPGEGYCRD